MPDKGKIMSQTYYERQTKLLKLYQASIARKEMNVNEAVTALRMIGFSKTIAAIRVSEWAAQFNSNEPETNKAIKHRLLQQASLEKYFLRMRLGKKHYSEYMQLRAKYKNKELSRDEAVTELMQSGGFSRKFSKCTVDKWEGERW